MKNTQPSGTDKDWWRQAVVYQVYPRSFADSNGDGIGDLVGITSRVPYLAELGVDAVWLSPFYPSPLVDGGYDVADYRDVDPRIGTLAEFDDMVAEFKRHGIRIFVDVVPNHSSDRHIWFQEALAAGRGSPERERYLFREGRGEAGELPPNDWPSHFGPTCWTRVADGQWYLHLFAPEQPDFNWQHPDVHEDFLSTLRFWSDRGVDGFRVDVAHGMAKDLSEPFSLIESFNPELTPLDGSHPLFDRDNVHEIYAAWRGVFNEYSPARVAVAEAWVPAARRTRYASEAGLGQAFNFDLLVAPWNAESFRTIISENLAQSAVAQSSSTWVLSNHDVVRHATRYGLPEGIDENAWLLSGGVTPRPDKELGLARARAATLLMLALPGASYLYQGEELGLFEVADLGEADLQDPIWFRSRGAEKGRDGCRVPVPWTSHQPFFGFSEAASHLPQPSWFGPLSVEQQERDPGSTLQLYRTALAARRTLLSGEQLVWVESRRTDVVHFARGGGWECLANFGSQVVPLPRGEIVVSSAPVIDGLLPGNATAWIRVGR